MFYQLLEWPQKFRKIENLLIHHLEKIFHYWAKVKSYIRYYAVDFLLLIFVRRTDEKAKKKFFFYSNQFSKQ